MAITKEKKKEIIKSLEKTIGHAKSVVFVNFHKVLVKEASLIRRSLKKENVGYIVAKKTLFKKVLNDAKIKGSQPPLSGELAVAYLSAEASAMADGDILAPARSIYEFQKKLEGKVSILGGIFDGEYKSREEMLGIASIPSLNVLRGMFVNIINSPVQRFVISLSEITKVKSS